MSKRILFISFLILGCISSGFSQIILPPTIQCVENSNTNGSITLEWTNPTPNPCGTFVSYTIYGSNSGPNGPYDSVIQVPSQATTSYTILNIPAGSTYYFYMVSNYGVSCPGSTVIHSDTVNNLNPAVPQIINVTVLPNNKVQFNWAPSSSPQTNGYIIYYYLPNGVAVPFDTVYGRSNTTIIDATGDPTQQSLVYTVSAFDSCGNRSQFNTSPQNSVYTIATNTECERQINISWNQYNNWQGGVSQYQIWVSINGAPFILGGTTDTGHLVYGFTSFNNGDSLTIFVRAINGNDSFLVADGNYIHMKALIVQPPSYIYITNVTVDLSNHIYITWTVDSIAQLIFYKLLQSVDSVTYLPTEQFAVPSPLTHFQTYGDSDYVFPQNNPYFYELDAFDSCQNQYISPFAETVCLKGGLWDYYVVKLDWNNFQLDSATVLRYNLYRDLGTGGGFQLIRTFQPGVNEYFDSLQSFLDLKGTFCYRIEAVYYLNLPMANYQDTLSSFSNEICVIHRPVIYVPNAFAPGSNVGVNQTFKPTIIYGDPHNYSMLIFNRWGQQIFESNSASIGWDGSQGGKEAEMGGYAYLIQFTADDGTPIVQKGIVMLVR